MRAVWGPVVVSEFGWSSDDAGVEQQAEWTAQAIELARCTPGLAGFVFWGFHDHPVPLGVTPDPWVRFGWLDAAGQPKPVFSCGLRRPARPARLHGRRAGRGRARGLAAAEHDPVPPSRSPRGSDVEARVLEIEVALHAVHDLRR